MAISINAHWHPLYLHAYALRNYVSLEQLTSPIGGDCKSLNTCNLLYSHIVNCQFFVFLTCTAFICAKWCHVSRDYRAECGCAPLPICRAHETQILATFRGAPPSLRLLSTCHPDYQKCVAAPPEHNTAIRTHTHQPRSPDCLLSRPASRLCVVWDKAFDVQHHLDRKKKNK